MQCPRCGDEIEPGAPCRRCQQADLLRSLAGHTQVAAVAEKECPRCGKATRADAAVCDKCGYIYGAAGSTAERYQAQLAEEARTAPPVPSALGKTVSPYLSWSVIGVCLLLMAGGAWLMLTASLPTGDATGAGEAIVLRSHHSRSATGTEPVIYQVTGTAARAMIAYRDADGTAVSPPQAVSLPWSQTFDARPGTALSVSATPNGGGTVACAISVDGKARKQSGTPDTNGLTSVNDTL